MNDDRSDSAGQNPAGNGIGPLGKSLSAKHQIGVLNRIPVPQPVNSQNSAQSVTANGIGNKK